MRSDMVFWVLWSTNFTWSIIEYFAPYDKQDNFIKFVGIKTRVTSSDLWVTSSDLRVTSSNPQVASSNPRVTSSKRSFVSTWLFW